MITSTGPGEPFRPPNRDDDSNTIRLKFACMHCKFRNNEKDGHPKVHTEIAVSRYSSIAELKEIVFCKYNSNEVSAATY